MPVEVPEPVEDEEPPVAAEPLKYSFRQYPSSPLAVRTFAQVAWELSKIVTDAPSAKVVTMP